MAPMPSNVTPNYPGVALTRRRSGVSRTNRERKSSPWRSIERSCRGGRTEEWRNCCRRRARLTRRHRLSLRCHRAHVVDARAGVDQVVVRGERKERRLLDEGAGEIVAVAVLVEMLDRAQLVGGPAGLRASSRMLCAGRC